MKKLCLIAGLPRSGSTLLCQLLASHPDFYVTPTSGIIDILRNIRSTFSHNPTWKAQDRLSIYENIRESLNGFLNGFFFNRNIVFDKSRGWTGNIELLDEILKHNNTKIIWCYRNPVDVVMSIETQYRKTILLENPDEASGIAYNSTEQRMAAAINDGGIVAQPVFLLDEAIKMGYGDRILMIKYGEISTNPQQVLNQIHAFIEEPEYTYDIENIKQHTYEYDGFYNYKFPHNVKEGKVQRKVHNTINVLSEDQISRINERFAWLNNLAFGINNNIQENTSTIQNEQKNDINPFVI